MRALVVSLNFNPGHFSHLVANYKLLEELGYKPYLYIHSSFNEMDPQNLYRRINFMKDINKMEAISLSVFWFPSLKNIAEIIKLRLFFHTKIFYVYHEPFDSFVSYYEAGFEPSKILKIYLINIVNIFILILSHQIILPSVSALSLYKKKYLRINRRFVMMPLLFDDENIDEISKIPKKYISYIGTVASDHAFDKFVNFINQAIKGNWFSDVNFLIATSSKIPDKERCIIETYISLGRVVVVEGNYMKNDQINRYYQESYIVWNAYHRSMQSGVLPKAYMFGAAVLVLRRNASPFIDDYKTGILITNNSDVKEIKNAIEEIISKAEFFRRNCRIKFLNTFYYKSYITEYRELINIHETI